MYGDGMVTAQKCHMCVKINETTIGMICDMKEEYKEKKSKQ